MESDRPPQPGSSVRFLPPLRPPLPSPPTAAPWSGTIPCSLEYRDKPAAGFPAAFWASPSSTLSGATRRSSKSRVCSYHSHLQPWLLQPSEPGRGQDTLVSLYLHPDLSPEFQSPGPKPVSLATLGVTLRTSLNRALDWPLTHPFHPVWENDSGCPELAQAKNLKVLFPSFLSSHSIPSISKSCQFSLQNRSQVYPAFCPLFRLSLAPSHQDGWGGP